MFLIFIRSISVCIMKYSSVLISCLLLHLFFFIFYSYTLFLKQMQKKQKNEKVKCCECSLGMNIKQQNKLTFVIIFLLR